MEFQNYIIFRDWFTLYFHDSKIESQYKKEKYIFWRMMLTLVCLFLIFLVVLSLSLWMMYNDKTKNVEIKDLIFNAVMALASLIFMLLLAFWKTKYWVFNMFCSLFMNFTQYIAFESIKIVSFVENQNKVGAFAITIVEFVIKGIWLFFVDDNFVYNLTSYVCFLPLYIAVFQKKYEKQENEIGFFIIIFTFLSIGIYFIERIFKINYFGLATQQLEIQRNRNLIDNMKSGFVMFNLDNSKVSYNKIMKTKFIPKLLQGTVLESNVLKKDDAKDKKEEISQINVKDNVKETEKKPMIDDIKDSKWSSSALSDEELRENEIQCNLVKNVLFSRLERVNAHDFEGDLKKASDEINMKINANNTRTNKYQFFAKKNESVDRSMFSKSESPLVKDKAGYPLLKDYDFEKMIAIFLTNEEDLEVFKYMGTKRVKQEQDEEFTCQIFVRYHNHGRNLEFVVCESTSKAQITSDALAKGLLNNFNNSIGGGFNNIAINNMTKINNTTIAKPKDNKISQQFLAKANSSIKHPLKEIQAKMKEAIELMENPDESIEDIKEILYYTENLAGLANYALEDLKYNKIKKKITLEKDKVDLPNLLENVMNLSKAKLKFASKEINLSYDIDKNVDDIIITDSKKLTHVLLNLIQNSISSSNKGSIHVLVEAKSKRKDMLCFTVFDQGQPMSKDKMDYYNRTNLDDFDKITGIVICKQIIETMGRDLRYEPNGNVGTKASFFIKIHDEEALNEDPQMTTDLSEEEDDVVETDLPKATDMMMYKQALPQLTQISAGLPTMQGPNVTTIGKSNSQPHKKFSIALGHEIVDTCDLRIIFADDDPNLRGLFRKHIENLAVLNNLKFELIECKDGADLLYSLYTYYEANKFVDALLFDENMNFITGAVLVEIVSILFKRSVIPDIPVFMSTEHEMNNTQYKFLKHLQKPVDYNQIKKGFAQLIASCSTPGK